MLKTLKSKSLKYSCIILTSIFLQQTNLSASISQNKTDYHSWSTKEHLELSKRLNLYFCKESLKQRCTQENTIAMPIAQVPLELDNGFKFSFAEIVMLAGDYFANGDNPITGDLNEDFLDISENNFSLKLPVPKLSNLDYLSSRFVDNFDALARNWQADYITDLVFKYLNNELTLDEAINLGLVRYDTAVKNYDHFRPYSWYAFSTGHYLAMKIAAKAGETQDQEILKYAYAVEAFAQHYLTDAFSSGHIRVPLKPIQRFTFFNTNGLLLTKFMHDEDAKFGVNVYNLNGDYWRAFGDYSYDIADNQQNRLYILRAQQIAISQVFNAYLDYNSIDYTKELRNIRQFMPIVNDNNNLATTAQVSPLFSAADDGSIYRRDNINNLADKNTTLLSQLGAISFLIEKLLTYNPS